MHSNTVQCGASGSVLQPLLTLAATAVPGLAMGAQASAGPPTAVIYRLIPLSPAASNADIKAAGQIAFTEFIGGVVRGNSMMVR